MGYTDFKILVVDDHFLLRQMVSTILKEHGIKSVDCVSSGASALEMIKSAYVQHAPYQVVFLDWSMPDMTGYEMLKLCREDKRFDDVAIIMLSAESEDSNIISVLESGATAYITKPFVPETLVKKLEDVEVWRKKKLQSLPLTQ